MVRIESDTIKLDQIEKDWIKEQLINAFNLSREKLGKVKITTIPRGSMSPFYRHLHNAIKEKTNRKAPLESSLNVFLIKERLTFTDEKILAILDFIEYYYPNICNHLRIFFNEEKFEDFKISINKLRLISKIFDFEIKFKELPINILKDESILLELGKYFEDELKNFEISDVIYKKILELTSNEEAEEYIARYFWYKRDNYGLAYSIYLNLLDSDNIDICASIHIYNYYIDEMVRKDKCRKYKIAYNKYVPDFNDISDHWLYLKYFYLYHFTYEINGHSSSIEIKKRTFINPNQILEYYLYLYSIKGTEYVENTIFNGLILKEKLKYLVDEGATLDLMDRSELISMIFKWFHFDLFYIATILNDNEINVYEKIKRERDNYFNFIKMAKANEIFLLIGSKINTDAIIDLNNFKDLSVQLLEAKYRNWIEYLDGLNCEPHHSHPILRDDIEQAVLILKES